MADEFDPSAFDVPSEPMGGKPAPVKLNSKEEFDKLSPGREFIDPEGKTRMKPYTAHTPEEYRNVPEGAHFIDPEGNVRAKPTFEGIDYTAQTLYDMSLTDKERRKALERSYPGKVKEDAEGLYVDDDGKLRRPGRGLSKVTGFISSAAAPTVGAALGALGGGAAGSAVPVAGTTAGAAAGGAGGALLGQGFNDVVLQLAGVYDRSTVEEAANLGIAGMTGMAGAGVGRGIATVVPSIKAGASALTAAAPSAARYFLGAGKEDIQMARNLTERGTMVPPSSVFKESPHLQNIAEIFDPAFRTQNPLQQSAVAHYEENAGKLLEEMGIKKPENLTSPEAAVSSKAAGEALMQKTLQESAEADANLAKALEARKAAAAAGQPGQTAQRESIAKEFDAAQAAAEKLINAGYADIKQSADNAFKVAKAGGNGGDLWQMVGEKLRAVKQGITQRASKMYRDADALAGEHRPNIAGLPETAEEFLNQIPEDFQTRYPREIAKLRDLAGVRDPKTGEWVKEPVQPTFGELHEIRSLFRGNADWFKLSGDVRNGSYKFFAKKVDDILHGINDRDIPEVQATAKSYEDFVKGAPQLEQKGLPRNDPRIERVATGIDPLIGELDRKFPSIAKKLKAMRDQFLAANENVNVDELWDQIDQALELVEKNGGKSELTDRLSKMLSDIGELRDEPMLRHMANKQQVDSYYKQVYRDYFDKLTDPKADWHKHTPPRQMLESLERPYEDRSGNPLFAYAEKAAWDDAAKVLRARIYGSERQNALKDAAKALDKADAFYHEQMPIFEAQNIRAVMRGLEAGEPADPKNLYNAIIKEGHTDLIKRIEKMVGPNLWGGIRAADVQEMLDASKTLNPGEIDGRAFARQVLDRHRSNLLEVVHGKEASEKLLAQARAIEQLEGRMPLPTRPGDTITTVIARARQAAEAAKAAAKADPLATLNKEMKAIERDHLREVQRLKRARRNDPLAFLYDPTTGASEAADRILNNEDLILAAAAKFGEKSPEFNMLRQVWATRMLQGTLVPSERLAKVSPEIQNLMFPGVTLEQMRTLAKEMDFLDPKATAMGTAGSMSAMAKVEHPWGGVISRVGKAIPGFNAVGRAARGKYYALVTELMNRPSLFRWLEKGLSGTPEQREATRQAIGAVLQKGGAVGAGAAEATYQGGTE